MIFFFEVANYYFFKLFFWPFLSVFSFWDHSNANVIPPDVGPEVLKYLHFLKFFFIFLLWVIFIALSSSSLIHPSTSSGQLLNPSSIVFSSVITSVWYFLIFSIALLKFLLCSFIILPSLVGIFMIITLNYLSGRLLIFISLMSFAGDLSCSLVWNVFLCLLILSDYLCLSTCIRQNTYFSQSWRSVLM